MEGNKGFVCMGLGIYYFKLSQVCSNLVSLSVGPVTECVLNA